MQTLTLRRAIIIGLAIRLTIAPFTAHPIDVYVFFVSGLKIIGLAPQGAICPVNEAYTFCRLNTIEDYFLPYNLAVLVFGTVPALIYKWLSIFISPGTFPTTKLPNVLNPGPIWQVAYVPGILFNFLVKLPLILSDLLVTLVIYKVVTFLDGDGANATKVAVLWFLNPLVIWISSGWGMFDTLPTLMTVLSLYLLIRRNELLSGLTLAVGVLFKYYPILLLPPVLVYTYRKKQLTGAVRLLLPLLVIAVAYIVSERNTIFDAIMELTNSNVFTLTGFNGLSIWTPIMSAGLSTSSGVIRYASDVILGGGILVVCLRIARRPPEAQQLFAIYTAVLSWTLSWFWFIGENFVVWLFPFLGYLIVHGSVRRSIYSLATFLPLISATTNSLLPYFFLPIYPWVGNHLISFMNFFVPARDYIIRLGETGISLKYTYLSLLAISTFLTMMLLFASSFRLVGGKCRVSDG